MQFGGLKERCWIDSPSMLKTRSFVPKAGSPLGPQELLLRRNFWKPTEKKTLVQLFWPGW